MPSPSWLTTIAEQVLGWMGEDPVIHMDGGVMQSTLITLPSERRFLLDVPGSYNSSLPHPMVLSFHGAGGTPYKQKRITNLSSSQHRIADMTFITVYPEGTNNTDWNMTHIWQGAPYENTTVDDIQLARDIIETVSTNYSIDHSRIYASGKSNGGGFTALLACLPETSEVFAAFAPVSPALYPGTRAFYNCSPSRPIPLLHVHGLEDPITPFYGVEKGWFGNEPDVRIWRAQWAERNGCRSKLGYTLPVPDDVQVKGNATVERWGCQEEVVAISVEGLGHSWPSREGRDTSGSPWHEADFDLTEDYLLDFFSSHRLDHGP